ncbi:hypothetical protein, partial [Okeania sp. SIO3I5]|uniref:hypothetical protein n=1 Tax=Okeania sp. SIO3I5 TaxID=2607805 RepID=UPI0025F48C21
MARHSSRQIFTLFGKPEYSNIFYFRFADFQPKFCFSKHYLYIWRASRVGKYLLSLRNQNI